MADDDLEKLRIDKTTVAMCPARFKAWQLWVLGVALLVAAAGLLYGMGILRPAIAVETVNVQRTYPSMGFTELNASGYVVAQRKAAVASKATGRLVWLGVEEGSRVQSGQVLARIENDDVRAGEAQAAAQLVSSRAVVEQALAERNDAGLAFGRTKELLADGFAAQADFDAAQARYRKAVAAVAGAEASVRAAAAALQAARTAVEFTLIRAPFAAVVLTKNADVGDIVTPLGAAADAKAAVVTIADMDSLQVEVDVAESNLEKVTRGQPCEIQLDAFPKLRFPGQVHMIVPTADRSKATVMVKVRFLDRDQRILPEMSAKVAFLSRAVAPGERTPRLTVPAAVLAHRNGRQVVFVVENDRVVARPVRVGVQIGDYQEVLSGVTVGQRVVLRPDGRLRDGSRVAVPEQ